MDLNESKKIVSIVAKNYPKFYSTYTSQDLGVVASTWQAVLADVTYKDAGSALIEYIGSADGKYPPHAGAIKQILIKRANSGSKLADAETAWQMVVNIIRTRPRDEYPQAIRELPKAIREWVGSSNTLESYANMDSSTLHGVVHSQFIKSYNAKVEQAREQVSAGNGSILIDDYLIGTNVNEYECIETSEKANSGYPTLVLVNGVMKTL